MILFPFILRSFERNTVGFFFLNTDMVAKGCGVWRERIIIGSDGGDMNRRVLWFVGLRLGGVGEIFLRSFLFVHKIYSFYYDKLLKIIIELSGLDNNFMFEI